MPGSNLHSRYAPAIDSPRCSGLFGIVSNVWTEAVDCTSKMVIGTADNVPVVHKRLEGLVDHLEGSMEYTAAEVSKGFVVGILPGT